MPTQDLNLRTAATTTIANVLGLLPLDIISVANSVTAIHKMIYGTNADARPIAHKTQQPPADDYQLYSNNCADQVIKIFERLGVNMDSTKGNPSIPANVLNFSKANGYPVPHNQIPFYQNSEDLGQYLRTQRLNAEARINLSQTNRSVAVPDNCRIANREAERTRHHQNQNPEQVTPVPTNNNSR